MASPKSPIRADYRLLRNIGKLTLGSFDPTPDDLDLIGKVFVESGGSWVRLFRGSPDAMETLKRIMKELHEKGELTRKSNWDAKQKKDK
jgi:hypothetical protein